MTVDDFSVVRTADDPAVAVSALLGGMPMRAVGAHAAPEPVLDDTERVARLCADYLLPGVFADVPVELRTGPQTNPVDLPSPYFATVSPDMAGWRVRLVPMKGWLAVVRVHRDVATGDPGWVRYPSRWDGPAEEDFRTTVAQAVNAALRDVDEVRLAGLAADAAGQLPGTPGPKQW